jgi:hypothetical protein
MAGESFSGNLCFENVYDGIGGVKFRAMILY